MLFRPAQQLFEPPPAAFGQRGRGRRVGGAGAVRVPRRAGRRRSAPRPDAGCRGRDRRSRARPRGRGRSPAAAPAASASARSQAVMRASAGSTRTSSRSSGLCGRVRHDLGGDPGPAAEALLPEVQVAGLAGADGGMVAASPRPRARRWRRRCPPCRPSCRGRCPYSAGRRRGPGRGGRRRCRRSGRRGICARCRRRCRRRGRESRADRIPRPPSTITGTPRGVRDLGHLLER